MWRGMERVSREGLRAFLLDRPLSSEEDFQTRVELPVLHWILGSLWHLG